jgi:probable HAF family extracellular repeat protein
VAPQIYQFRAALWGPGKNEMRQLPPLGNDRTSAATAINNKGQVVGISGACGTAVGGVSAEHAVMWDKGRTIFLGTLGGVAWNTPMALNERGDVVGFSNVSEADGAAFNAQAFRWTRGRGIENLGVLPGDSLSQALGINDKGQIVGISCTAGFASCRAFLFDHGVMMDLNELLPDDYADHLFTANDINNNGQITGQAIKAGTEELVPVWLIPVDSRGHRDSSDAAAVAKNDTRAVPLSAEAKQRVLLRAFATEAQLGK